MRALVPYGRLATESLAGYRGTSDRLRGPRGRRTERNQTKTPPCPLESNKGDVERNPGFANFGNRQFQAGRRAFESVLGLRHQGSAPPRATRTNDRAALKFDNCAQQRVIATAENSWFWEQSAQSPQPVINYQR